MPPGIVFAVVSSDVVRKRHTTLRTIAASAMAALVAVGCADAQQLLPHRTPYPVSSSVVVLPLATEPPASSGPNGPPVGCPMAAIGTIELVAAGGDVRFIEAETGQVVNLVWPRGFLLIVDEGVAELLAPDGSVVMHAGQSRSDFVGGGDHVCQVGNVTYPPSS
jgi:hypothetical protein